MSVSFSLLLVAAFVGVAAAGLVAALRRLAWPRVKREAGVAAAVAALSVAAGIACYAAANRVAYDSAYRNAGAACLASFPLIGALVLRAVARRRGWRPGSAAAALVSGLAAVLVVAAWVTLAWIGPRGGWQALDIFVFFCCAVVLYSAALCLGWWCARGLKRAHA